MSLSYQTKNLVKVVLAAGTVFFFAVLSGEASALSEPAAGEVSAPDRLRSHYEGGEVSADVFMRKTVEMEFTDAIRLALEQNLELRASSYAARAQVATYQKSLGLYDPRLLVHYRNGEMSDLLNLAPPNDFDREYSETTVSLVQKLPLGTEIALSGQLYEQEEIPQPAVDPAYDSYARLSLAQPLLKGFGFTATERSILLSDKDRLIGVEDLREQATVVVADVRNAYFEALQAQYALSYREASVELARKIVEENSARVEAGVLAPVEKLEAEVGLQSRERLLLDAQNAFSDALDRLNLLLNASATYYRPVILPFSMDFVASEDDGFAAATKKRPDVVRKIRQIEKSRIEQSVAKNDLLPELNVVANYTQNGLAAERSESFDMVSDGDYDSWEVGVEFTYPLFNIEGRNELKRADIALKRQRSLLSQLHNEVRNEIRAAIRRIDVNRKKTEVAKRGHDLATEKLRILMKSREVGLATTRDVLDGEEDLASARNDEITSVADYFKSITDYLQATGMLLENEGVVFAGGVGTEEDSPLFYIVK